MNDLIIEYRKEHITKWPLSNLYYFASLDNLTSLLNHGILSKNDVIRGQIQSTSFAEASVQQKRMSKRVILDNDRVVYLHDLVPLYLTPKTPTLSARRELIDRLFFVDVSLDLLYNPAIDLAFTDGNAASQETTFYSSLKNLSLIPWDVIQADYWNEFTDGSRKRCAEFLVYPRVSPTYFTRLVVSSQHAQETCRSLLFHSRLHHPPITVIPDRFFRPS